MSSLHRRGWLRGVGASLAGLWRKVWAGGPAGSEVVLKVGRDNETLTVRVLSVDRTQFYKAPKLH